MQTRIINFQFKGKLLTAQVTGPDPDSCFHKLTVFCQGIGKTVMSPRIVCSSVVPYDYAFDNDVHLDVML